LALALDYNDRLRSDIRFSSTFAPCIHALRQHVADAERNISRIG
jgi:hypothetical protein